MRQSPLLVADGIGAIGEEVAIVKTLIRGKGQSVFVATRSLHAQHLHVVLWLRAVGLGFLAGVGAEESALVQGEFSQLSSTRFLRYALAVARLSMPLTRLLTFNVCVQSGYRYTLCV